jgi:hypothetical protein
MTDSQKGTQPKYPKSQGSVERHNQMIMEKLRKFESTTHTSNVNTSAKTTAKANENKTQNSDK